MTVYEIVNRVWRDCGEPTDLDPAVDSTQLVEYLNTSMDCVVTWKGLQGRRRAHFPDYITSGYKKNLREVEVALDVSLTFDEVELTSLPSTFTVTVGDYLEYDGETKLIYYIDTNTLYLDSGFSTDPTGLNVTVVQTLLDPSFSRMMSFLRVENVDTKETLEPIRKQTSYLEDIGNPAEPLAWRRKGGKIEFDVLPDEAYLWKIWYYRLPTQAVAADYVAENDPDLPDEFQVAAEAYMKSLVYKHMQETDMSVAEYRTFANLMTTIQGSWEQDSMISGGRVMGMAV